MRKCTFGHVQSAKTQVGLRMPAVWLQSLLGAHWLAKDPWFLQANSEKFDQITRMCRFIWDVAGHTLSYGPFSQVLRISLCKQKEPQHIYEKWMFRSDCGTMQSNQVLCCYGYRRITQKTLVPWLDCANDQTNISCSQMLTPVCSCRGLYAVQRRKTAFKQNAVKKG